MSTQSTETLYDEALPFVRTVEERALFHGELETALQSLYIKDAEKLVEFLERNVRHSTSQFIKKVLLSENDNTDTTALKNTLEGLRVSLLQMPIIHLDIAFEPTNKTSVMLSTWLRTHVQKDIVIEYGLDRTLIAGARIIFNGKNIEVT